LVAVVIIAIGVAIGCGDGMGLRAGIGKVLACKVSDVASGVILVGVFIGA
jgi:hypothetical protein